MTQQMLIKIGDRIIDLSAITNARYRAETGNLIDDETEPMCCVYFSSGNSRSFYKAEADLVWKLLSDRAVNLTPLEGAAE